MANDLHGKQIEEGDLIAYALANFNKRPTMAVYRVLKINPTGTIAARQIIQGGHRVNTDQRVSTLNFPGQRAVITQKWSEFTA